MKQEAEEIIGHSIFVSYKEAMDNHIYAGDDGPTTTVEASDDRGSNFKQDVSIGS